MSLPAQLDSLVPSKARRLRQQRGNVRLDTLVAYAEPNAKPVATISMLRVTAGIVWEDSVPLAAGEGRLLGLYVDPESRGLGLGAFLEKAALWLASSDRSIRLITEIVEERNRHSIGLKGDWWDGYQVNYLVKAFGRNVLSCLVGEPSFRVWYVGPGRGLRLRAEVKS